MWLLAFAAVARGASPESDSFCADDGACADGWDCEAGRCVDVDHLPDLGRAASDQASARRRRVWGYAVLGGGMMLGGAAVGAWEPDTPPLFEIGSEGAYAIALATQPIAVAFVASADARTRSAADAAGDAPRATPLPRVAGWVLYAGAAIAGTSGGIALAQGSRAEGLGLAVGSAALTSAAIACFELDAGSARRGVPAISVTAGPGRLGLAGSW